MIQGVPKQLGEEDDIPLPPYRAYNIGNSSPENLLDYVNISREGWMCVEVLSINYNIGA